MNKDSNSFAWPGLDEPRKPQRTDEQKELAKLFLRVFGTPDGDKLLDHFYEKFTKAPVALPGSVEGLPYYLEGKRDVVRYIEKQIKTARGLND